MAVKIRLRRMGARSKPFYRLVVADSRSPRDGRFIDMLGYYNPRSEPPVINVDAEKALLWLGRGAQPTDTAAVLLKKAGISHKALKNKEKTEKEPVMEAEPALETEAATESKTKSTRRRKTSQEDEAAQVETTPAATETGDSDDSQAAEENTE